MSGQIFSPRRIRTLAGGNAQFGRPVLCFLSRALRAWENPALDFAVQKANERQTGVWVLVVLDPACPRMFSRHPSFFFDGLADLAAGLRRRRIPLRIQTGDAVSAVLENTREACMLVCDEHPEPWARRQRELLAKRAGVPVMAVEADALVPPQVAADHAHVAARTLRPAIWRLMDEFLPYEADLEVRFPLADAPETGKETLADPTKLDSLRIPEWDFSLETKVRPMGGQKNARIRLMNFVQKNLNDYPEMHHRADLDVSSGLGPYLRCGHLGIHEVVRACRDAKGPGADAFLEQVIVRRELAINAAWFHPAYGSAGMIPEWARRTLTARPRRCQAVSFGEMENACTPDEAWNAAMMELKSCGTMHNYMRMYWGKQVLYWSENFEEAFYQLLKWNDTYFWDGCEPNGTVGVAWVFGLHDRPFAARDGFGLVRSMTPSGLARKFDVGAYVKRVRRKLASL